MKHLVRLIIAGLLLALLLIGRATPLTQAQGLVLIVHPSVEGILGANGWYISNVTVTWPAVQSDWTLNPGTNCSETIINQDTTGTTLICAGTTSGPNAVAFYGEVTIKRDATPPVINANLSPDPASPTVVNEGDSLQADASASTDATSGIANIMWDLDEDGSFEASNPALFEGIDGLVGAINPMFLVGLAAQATDQAGNAAQTNFPAAVLNLPANLGPVTLSAGTIPLGGSVEASVNFIDPGILDTHTAVINWGDGPKTGVATVTESGGKGVATDQHTYITPGSHTIQITVTDKDGGVGAAPAVVTVQDAPATIDMLIAGTQQEVVNGVIKPGQGKSLVTKLDGAKVKISQGQIKPAINKLNAYLHQLSAVTKADPEPCWIVGSNLLEALRAITPSD